eukprot:COSAG05_NODE_11303_length_520_cov_1.218527_1_plen_93_part_10
MKSEWYMLALALIVVGLAFAAEVRDIHFTRFSATAALKKQQPLNCCGTQSSDLNKDTAAGFFSGLGWPPTGWFFALSFLAFARQLIFLPLLIT